MTQIIFKTHTFKAICQGKTYFRKKILSCRSRRIHLSISRAIYFLFFILLIGSACSHKAVFEEVKPFEEGIWNRFNSLSFKVDDVSSGEYDVYFIFEIDTTYSFANLTIDFTYFGSERETRTRPHSVSIIDEEGGFSGQKNQKGLIEYQQIVIPGLKIHKSSSITFEVDNVMPVYDLRGVHSAGLRIVKHKKTKN